MNRREGAIALTLIACLAPSGADAHGNLAGLGGFYGGLLHPLVVPAEAFAVVATGLALGSAGRNACRIGLPLFVSAVAAGLVSAVLLAPTIALTTELVLAAALLAGIAVAAFARVPGAIALAAAAFAGLAVGLDAAPEVDSSSAGIVAGAAVMLGSGVIATVISAVALRRTAFWHGVAMRVAGSWIAACALLSTAILLR